ncbi:hypothetical protein K9L67_03130 [Candidatus Woesearchaeota archaeon]|nr:hypothetical protein [Candidatus Woesearchaeota archaeon]MCF7901195.1 hypothetical protein [Candidatus Woesearchaeota archaeon]MCF8013710.1 hypothetical protein [Candidatus Woesearchaeota archaeon]
MIKKLPFFDLVICGPDMSGTTSQINALIAYLSQNNNILKDMRGTEKHAYFHAELFNSVFKNFRSYEEFINSKSMDPEILTDFIFSKETYNDKVILTSMTDKAKEDSQKEDPKFLYINPEKADAWVFEEPTKRGAGQSNRVIEQNMSEFHRELDPKGAGVCHSVYRKTEFLRFREPLREKDIPIIRSRSEESGAYQIYDEKNFPRGINLDYYLNLPGHKFAFSNPPTHIFAVHAPYDWTKDEYVELKKQRSKGRVLDDHELNAGYQVMVNKRYASNWLHDFYNAGCSMYGSKMPKIIQLDIMLKPEKEVLETIVKTFKSEVLKAA